MTIRPYEKPLLFVGAILVALLLVAIYQPRLLLIEPSSATAASGADQTPANVPDAQVTAQEAHPVSDTVRDGAAGEAHPPMKLLCAAEEEITTVGNSRAGIAADRKGHFTVYGLPDRSTGLPGRDSYELLRGCVPGTGEGPSYGNQLLLRIATPRKSPVGLPTGGRVFSAGDAHLHNPTRAERGALITTYRFPRGITLVQRLSVHGAGARISYTVFNGSRNKEVVSLRSLISPTPAAGPYPYRRLFELAASTKERAPGADTVFDGPQVPEAITVPRPGAASDASAVWRAHHKTPTPTKLVIAGYHRLVDPPFDYEAKEAYPLPPNLALAVYWEGLELSPKEGVTVSHTYAQPSPDRSSESPAGVR